MQRWYLSLLLNMGRALKQDIAQKCRHVSLSPSYGVAVGTERNLILQKREEQVHVMAETVPGGERK